MYNIDDVTFVSGFWMVERPIKYEFNHYHSLIPKTFSLLENKNIAFFYEDRGFLDYLNKYIKTKKFLSYYLHPIDLPANEITKDYINTCKEQDAASLKKIYPYKEGGFLWYENVEKGLGKWPMMKDHEPSYFTQTCIMLSKSFLVKEIIKKNPFNTNYFAWADLSISRFRHNRKNADFTKFDFTNKYMYHYSSFMRYYGKRQKVNGSFMFGHKSKWEEFLPLYEGELIKLKNSKYCHSDESVITSVVNKSPDLFKAIDDGERPRMGPMPKTKAD